MSEIPHFNFDDMLLCCIFGQTNQCEKRLKQSYLCATLLPIPSMVYITSSVGGACVIYNIIAFYATLRFRHFVYQNKFNSFLDIHRRHTYHVCTSNRSSRFLLQVSVCPLSEPMDTEHFVWVDGKPFCYIATLLSIYFCRLHIYLMSQAITKLRSNVRDEKHRLIIAEITVTIIAVFFKITCLVDVFTTESKRIDLFSV